MKIALLSEKYTPDIGGLAISAGRLAGLLASAGHEVQVFAPTSGLPPSDARTHASNGVTVTRLGAHKRVDDTLVDWFELIVEEHRRKRFDILHAYFLPQAGFVAAYAGKYLKSPSVVSIRGNDIERAAFDPSKFSHVMYALQHAGAVTTNAAMLAAKARAFIERDIIIIPNGIDAAHFKRMEKNPALAEALGLKGRVIGFVGELREKKGLKTLLNGYAQLTGDTSLLIVGSLREGEDQRNFEEWRASIPNAKVVVTGMVPQKDLPAYYALMDVFVHPSLRDGMPNALLEAMACEVPVVSTPVGGALDVITDQVNGMLMPVNDMDALVQAVEKLFENEALRRSLGRAARAKITNEFTPQNELNANLAIYKRLLQR
jgi:glycosyltransferase involved in cell wall biosynthesis